MEQDRKSPLPFTIPPGSIPLPLLLYIHCFAYLPQICLNHKYFYRLFLDISQIFSMFVLFPIKIMSLPFASHLFISDEFDADVGIQKVYFGLCFYNITLGNVRSFSSRRSLRWASGAFSAFCDCGTCQLPSHQYIPTSWSVDSKANLVGRYLISNYWQVCWIAHFASTCITMIIPTSYTQLPKSCVQSFEKKFFKHPQWKWKPHE